MKITRLLIIFAALFLVLSACDNGTNPIYTPTDNTDNERIATKDFEYLGSIGTDAVSPGALREPEDLLVVGDYLYVVDTDNHRVNKYDLSGNFQYALEGEYGPFQYRDAGGFVYPRSITADGDGNIYVMDTQNERVQIFNSSGQFLREFGTEGSETGQFEFPFGIALDDQKNIYVADTYNYRIQKFTNTGTFLTSWSTTDSTPELIKPRYIEIIGDRVYTREYSSYGDVLSYALDGSDPQILSYTYWHSDVYEYEVDTTNDEIDIYVNSAVSSTISNASLDLGNVEKVEDDAYGNYYLLETDLYRIRKIDSAGNVLVTFGSDRELPGEFINPRFMDTDENSLLYVTDKSRHRISVFDKTYALQTTIGEYGHNDQNIVYPDSVTYSPGNGNIYIRHMYGISEFTKAGVYVRKILTDPPPYGDIEADANGNIIYTAIDYPCVTILDSTGTVLDSWGSAGEASGQLDWPYGINFSDQGNLIIADSFNYSAKSFDSSGILLDTWVHPDKSWLKDIARDIDGNYYMLSLDPSNTDPTVMVLDSDFSYLGEFGYRGADDGEFMEPYSVRVNDEGIIFVSDEDRSDVQYFRMIDISDRSLARSALVQEEEIVFPDEEKME